MDCQHQNIKEIGRYTVDCGISGEVTFVRRRCLDCGQITMTKVYEDCPVEEEKEPCEVNETKPKPRRKQSIIKKTKNELDMLK